MTARKPKNRVATRKERPKPDPRSEHIENVAKLLSMFRGGDWPLDTETFRDDCRWDARMIVNAVAADIWEDGYGAGMDDECAHQRGVGLDELSQYTPNPYRASETE